MECPAPIARGIPLCENLSHGHFLIQTLFQSGSLYPIFGNELLTGILYPFGFRQKIDGLNFNPNNQFNSSGGN
jgi:hypothetical protein